MMRRSRVAALFLGTTLAACGPSDAEPDAFLSVSDAFASDARSAEDAGGDAAAAPMDADLRADAPILEDALVSSADAATSEDAASTLDDAFTPPMDAFVPVDAFVPADAFAPTDAFVPVDAFAFPRCSAPDLAVPTTPTPPALVISEIDPGTFIEIYNPTASNIALAGTSYQFCSPFVYASLASLGPAVTVPSHGYARLPWPAGFADTEAGGEVSLYTSAAYADPAAVMSFVCWGTNPHGTRKTTAETGGRWSGACAGAITAGRSIARRPATTGTLAGDWATDAVPTPETCGP